MVQPDSSPPPPERPDDEGNVVKHGVFQERRALKHEGQAGLLARATAAERAVVSLEGRVEEIRHELSVTAAHRDRLAAELNAREIELRTAAQRDRQALEQELAGARALIAETQRRLDSERARSQRLEGADGDRQARLAAAETALEQRAAALRARELETDGVRSALETRREALEGRLREVDHSLVDLTAQVSQEQSARESAEAALVAERTAREQQVALLQSELDARTARVEGVQRQVGELRAELVGVLGGEAISKADAKARLKEIKRDLKDLGTRALELERERDEAAAELAQADVRLRDKDAELDRLRAETSTMAEQLAAVRAELAESRGELDQARISLREAAHEAELEREARRQLEAELEGERELFRQQLEVADSQLRSEIALQRKAFDEHTGAVERSIQDLHARLAEARERMLEQVGAERDARQAAEANARAAEDRLEQMMMESVAASLRLPEMDPSLVRPAGERPERTGELADDLDAAARRLREQPAPEPDTAAEPPEAAAAPEAAPDEGERFLPRREPVADAETPWMLDAFQRLAQDAPDTAARALVDLLPATADALPRNAVIDFAVDELGAYRLTVHLGSGSIAPWRSGAPRQADLALAGTAGALAPLVAGQAGRKLKGVEYTGRKRVLRKLLKARKAAVSLGALQASRITPALGPLLALAASCVDPEWIGGRESSVCFSSAAPGGGSWTVRCSQEGLRVDDGTDDDADASVFVPAEGVLALLIGSEPPVAGRPTVSGDAGAANFVLSLLDRARCR